MRGFSPLPPETTWAARGHNVNVTRRLAALAARVPHVGLPCEALRVAGESGDGVRASYLRSDPLSLTSTESITRPDYPSEFHWTRNDLPTRAATDSVKLKQFKSTLKHWSRQS